MRALAVLFGLAAGASLVHAESRPRYGGGVEGTLLGAPVTFDPPAAQSHAELTVIDLVFDTLYRIGPDGVVQPRLAVAAPAVDGTRARISLRQGVRFHDGSLLTAADVVASLERVRTTTARWAVAGITDVRAAGEIVELTLEAGAGDLATQLALPATAITRRGRAAGSRPVGSGPFKLAGFDRKAKRLSLVAFDGHFAGRPYLDRLTLRWYDTPDGEARRFETGAAQLSTRGVAAFTGAQPTYRADDVESPAALLVFIGFGRAHAELTADRSFRRAIDLVVARSALASVTSGERIVPTHTPVPVEAGAAAVDPAVRGDELGAARAALAVAARRVKALAPGRLRSLRLEILVEDSRPDDREVAERVAHGLRKLGLDSITTSVTAPVLRDRVRRGTCDLYIGQLAAPIVSARAWWGAAFAAGGDRWIEQQLATGALDAAAAARGFAQRLPVIPLLFRAVRIWHRSDVRGLGFDASGRPGYADLFLFGDPARSKKP